MQLTDEGKGLAEKAKSLAGERKVSGGTVKGVGAALVTEKGRIFTGVSLNLWCGIGFCAEHAAIADMVSHSSETRIKIIVAHCGERIMYPCGRCRELMELIDRENREITEVIVSENEKVLLKELLPGEWMH
ncbi:cytidine deaminase [Candidatus Micrarchaeota archaeon]|nr:cytidine deaminase [Candidatus Micrarchaeota archaeon]